MLRRSLSVLACLALAISVASAQPLWEDWNCATPGTTTCGSTNTGLPWQGWTTTSLGNGAYSWILDGGGTSSSSTGPSDDVGGGGLYAYTEASCGSVTPYTAALTSPIISASGPTVPMSFWYHTYGSNVTTSTFDLQESDGVGGWTTIWSYPAVSADMWINQTATVNAFDVGMGNEVQVRFLVTRGASYFCDWAVDDISIDGGVPPIPPPSSNQENLPNASLELTGTLCAGGGGGVCSPVPFTPYVRLLDANNQTTMTVDTGANSFMPYAAFFTPGYGVTPGAGLLTAWGYVDFDLTGLGVLTTLVDGFAQVTLADQLLGTTLANGQRTLQLAAPAGAPGLFGTFQAMVFDPTSPNLYGLQITAATELRYPFGGTSPPPPPPPCQLPNPVTGGGDDTSTQIVFTTGLTVPFYGAVYTDVYVGSNGYVTFGGPDTTYTESASAMLNDEPRVAGLWDDLTTSGGGNNYLETANSIQISYEGVPQLSPAGPNDFCIQIYGTGAVIPGLITLSWGVMTATDGLIGISPGGIDPLTTLPWSPVGVATGASIDFSTQVIGAGYIGTPTEAIFELFPTGTFDLGYPGGLQQFDPCTGMPIGGSVPVPTLINFTPNPTMGVPGDLGYTGT